MRAEDIQKIHKSHIDGKDHRMYILIDTYGNDFWDHYKRWLYSEYSMAGQYRYFSEVVIIYMKEKNR